MNDLPHDPNEFGRSNKGYNHGGETNGMNNSNKVIKEIIKIALCIYTLA
jgi:hypothetical protein